MSKPPPRKPLGRSVIDENGNRKWTWQTEDIDTARVRALGEELSLDTATPEDKLGPGNNPYDSAAAKVSPVAPKDQPKDQRKRRTLDDMRKLSEHIKRTKTWTRDKK